MGGSFGDLHPGSDHVGFQPMKPGDSGATNWWDARMFVDPSWASKACFSRAEYDELFFTLFHEGMHSSDDIVTRFLTSNSNDDAHHNDIRRREHFERFRPSRMFGNMWGIPRDKPLNVDQLYRQYRARTPSCCGK
jgi:hypothetical protein